MMNKLVFAAAAVAIVAVPGIATAQTAPMPWAYGFTTPPPPNTPQARPGAAQPQDNTTKLSLPGSTLQFTRAQVANRFGPADWFPGDHPVMPKVVSNGREGANIYACGLCHYPNGKGRPENANVSGYSYNYIVQQLVDFRNGARRTSDPRKANTGLMEHFAKEMTNDEISDAAKYFAAIPATPWITTVEAAMVPKTRPQGGMYLRLEGNEAGMEPIGARIIETPINTHDTEFLRNPRSGFTAYVPPGSLQKGKALVENGTTAKGQRITACVVCHGSDLHGIGQAPHLAGRSPSYLGRQLYDMKVGNRNGAWTPLMAPVIAGMEEEDLLNASAYLASLRP